MSNMMAIDWTMGSFRAYFIDETGKILLKSATDEGLLSVEGGTFQQIFEEQLADRKREPF